MTGSDRIDLGPGRAAVDGAESVAVADGQPIGAIYQIYIFQKRGSTGATPGATGRRKIGSLRSPGIAAIQGMPDGAIITHDPSFGSGDEVDAVQVTARRGDGAAHGRGDLGFPVGA